MRTRERNRVREYDGDQAMVATVQQARMLITHLIVPHTAFQLGGEKGEPRESIEVRALVYYGGPNEPFDGSTR
jgi:hypothetical protein